MKIGKRKRQEMEIGNMKGWVGIMKEGRGGIRKVGEGKNEGRIVDR